MIWFFLLLCLAAMSGAAGLDGGFADRLARLGRGLCYLLAVAVIVLAHYAQPAEAAVALTAGVAVAAVLLAIGHAFKWLLTGRA